MKKTYKNVCGTQINVDLFGYPKQKISADAQAVELDEALVTALNARVCPNVALEEVAGDFKSTLVEPEVSVDEPVVELDNVDELDDNGEIVESKEAYSPADEDYTIAELKAMCKSKGILYNLHDTKATLHDKVFNG